MLVRGAQQTFDAAGSVAQLLVKLSFNDTFFLRYPYLLHLTSYCVEQIVRPRGPLNTTLISLPLVAVKPAAGSAIGGIYGHRC